MTTEPHPAAAAYGIMPAGQIPAAQAAAIAETSAIARQRKPVPAYLLCIFLGTLGLHRFYLHRNGSALAMLLVTLLTLGAGTLVTTPWAIVDLFLIPRIIREENLRIRSEAYARFGLVALETGEPAPQTGTSPA